MKKSVFKLAAAECVLVCVMLFFSRNLLFAQSSLSAKDNALFEAAKSVTVADVKAAIKNGANVNAKDKDGSTVLMYAASDNTNPDVIKALIAAGANVNARDEDGWTALMSAAAADNSNPDVIKALIAAGSDANARDRNGKRAIDHLESNEKISKTDDAYWTIRDLLY